MYRNDALPSFRDPWALIRECAAALRPPAKTIVSEWAQQFRRLKNPSGYSGPWKNDKAPYLVEPMNRTLARDVAQVTIVGPSQCGKSEVALNVIGHAVQCRPRDILMLLPTQEMCRDFAERRLKRRLIDPCETVAAELGEDRGDDKALTKSFKSGMMVSVAWPAPSQLASRPVPLVIIDERDRMSDDVGDEGDPVALARNRTKSFGKDGCVLVISSPSRLDSTGIISDFDAGDRRLWAVPCVECDEYFTPGFDHNRRPTLEHLDIPEGCKDPHDAYEQARLACPNCGGLIEYRHQHAMNMRGRWVAQGQWVDTDGQVHGEPPRTRSASYSIHGLVAAFIDWGTVAYNWMVAEQHYERTGDESKLKTFFNTDLGVNYTPRHEGETPVEAHELADRREPDWAMGVVPKGALFLTAAVDTQKNRFEVLVRAWGANYESWLIDRFAIRQLEDGKTDLRPASYPEHWNVLLDRVVQARYPLAEDPEQVMPIATTAIDTGGLDGVWPNAQAFYRKARKAGVPDRQIMLIKGSSNPNAPMLPRPSYELDGKGRIKRGGWKLYNLGVSALKDGEMNRMRREVPGEGYIHLPSDFSDDALAEMTSEHKEGGRWVQDEKRNETFDLLGYTAAGYLRVRPWKVNWDRPPVLLRPEPATPAPDAEDVASEFEQPDGPEAELIEPEPVEPQPEPATRKRRFRRKPPSGGGFVNNW